MFVSVVMPCLNEHETLGICIQKAKDALDRLDIEGEIIVADNGSKDGSQEIARSYGVRVVEELQKGYGNAYRAGIAHARGDYIIIGDSDDSYDFSDIGRFYDKLKDGYDLVMGTRLKGRIEKGAMPWLHQYVGNPILTGILNIFFRSGISDAHCGMRAFTRDAYDKMELQTAGMEFASEMVIKASLLKLKIIEIPITLHRDGRSGAPHLRSFRDGWRHLRFMLLHSPSHLYMWPGFFLFCLGMLTMLLLLLEPFYFGGRLVDLHIMVFGSLLSILGFQTITLGIYARIYAVTHNFIPQGQFLQRMFKIFNLERGLALGAFIFALGFGLGGYIFFKWMQSHGGAFNELRFAIFASTLLIIGTQVIFSSFFLSMLGIARK
ncbi:glycosyltransferase family 2 protein [candidate division KSB1 bacterium]|nr:glycosyltransferase family 2 protein [candidate division KSB1 bacterium]